MGRGTRKWPGFRAAAVGGLAGASATTLLIGLVHTFAPAVPFLPESIAQSLVRVAPGEGGWVIAAPRTRGEGRWTNMPSRNAP